MPIKILAFAAGLVVASAALAQTSQLEVSNAWARATPAKAETGAAYATIQSPTAGWASRRRTASGCWSASCALRRAVRGRDRVSGFRSPLPSLAFTARKSSSRITTRVYG